MADYTAYIPAVGSATYPTQITSFILSSEAIATEIELARSGELTLLDRLNLKLNLSGGTLSGGITLSSGTVTIGSDQVAVKDTSLTDGNVVSADSSGRITTTTGIVAANVVERSGALTDGNIIVATTDNGIQTTGIVAANVVERSGALTDGNIIAATTGNGIQTTSIATIDIATLSGIQTFTGDKHFSGTITAVTQSAGDNSTKIATTAYADSVTVVPDVLRSMSVNNWRVMTSPADNDWRGVCWAPALKIYCAISSSGVGNRVMWSQDGYNWNTATSAADNDWQDICWSESLGLFVAVSNTGTLNRVMTSPNGTAWTIQTTPTDDGWSKVLWSEESGLFCAVATGAYTGTQIMTSPNGTTWTSRTPSSALYLNCLGYSPTLGSGGGRFVAGSLTGSTMIYSDDGGLTWSNVVGFSSTDDMTDMDWSPELGLFVAVAISGSPRIHYSSDGLNWTEATITNLPKITGTGTTPAPVRIRWSSELGLFLAVSETNFATWSKDGVVWYHAFVADATLISGLCWSPLLRQFAVVRRTGTGDRVLVSM